MQCAVFCKVMCTFLVAAFELTGGGKSGGDINRAGRGGGWYTSKAYPGVVQGVKKNYISFI